VTAIAKATLRFVLAGLPVCAGACHRDAGQSRDVAVQTRQPAAKFEERSPAPAEKPSELRSNLGSPAASTPSPWLADRGVYDEFNDRVHIDVAPWLALGPIDVWRSPEDGRAWFSNGGVPIAAAPADAETTVRGASAACCDRDADGLVDVLDVLAGAKKVALNAARYHSAYRALPYPEGDVPRTEGVCSDVVVRALRNAGFDLQRLLHEDVKAHPTRYPEISTPDPNIDHRRVKNLLRWFTRHWDALPNLETGAGVWLPADVLFFDTLHGPEPDHIGIVTDEVGQSGLPLIINNWTDGTREAAMDLLAGVRVTHAFRLRSARLPVETSSTGLEGVLVRAQLQLPEDTRQVILVTVPHWQASFGRLQRFQRTAASPWQAIGSAVDVRIGGRGLALGRGLHVANRALSANGDKREGDRRAVAGVFALGPAFGPQLAAPGAAVRWPWRQIRAGDVFVDDPASRHYNRWISAADAGVKAGVKDWASAEDLRQYELGLVVEHNTAPTLAGAGSAIFIHSSDLTRPTLGCTGVRKPELLELLAWLEPSSRPVLVQVAGALYEAP
jgi:uncharacterized protein YijF (DUF1287 family)/L,D-peptidoglycan transpeptidase YkuD (ErfK/YbiS/YcfS/YnhG family)